MCPRAALCQALLDAGTRLEMLDAGGARRCLEAAFASAERELPCTSKVGVGCCTVSPWCPWRVQAHQ